MADQEMPSHYNIPVPAPAPVPRLLAPSPDGSQPWPGVSRWPGQVSLVPGRAAATLTQTQKLGF